MIHSNGFEIDFMAITERTINYNRFGVEIALQLTMELTLDNYKPYKFIQAVCEDLKTPQNPKLTSHASP